MKLIIAGSRTWHDYEKLKAITLRALKGIDFSNVVIISGMAPGVDKLGVKFAQEHGIPVKPFPAKWSDLTVENCKIKIRQDGTAYNILAGFNRNEQMADVATHLLAFWNKKSPGTGNMIKLAKERDLKVHTIYI